MIIVYTWFLMTVANLYEPVSTPSIRQISKSWAKFHGSASAEFLIQASLGYPVHDFGGVHPRRQVTDGFEHVLKDLAVAIETCNRIVVSGKFDSWFTRSYRLVPNKNGT